MTPSLPRAWCAALLALLPAYAAAQVTVAVQPARPLIEQGKGQQLLNFDFLVDNRSGDKIELSEIEVTVLAAGETLVAQYRLGGNGNSIATVPDRVLEAGKQALLFNPVYAYPAELDLRRVRYDFKFDVGGKARYTATAMVEPVAYRTRTALRLPLASAALIHDGHDFYGHHRRLPLLDPMAVALGWKRNFMRYSYDFIVTDAQGRMYQGDGSRNEDWYGWGAPVLAPAAGTVLRAVGAVPDNAKGKRPPFSREQFIADPAVMWGNHVEIDHGNGEISLLAHLRQGSVALKVGDKVKAGQQVGAMGFSGDAFLVHLHYDLKNGPGFDADGLPSPFRHFERRTGAGWLKVRSGHIDSGDLVRPAP
ncbi:MAG TPA: M23 family metallopeptidase [Burkholderiaceae bacterium]